MIRHQTQGPCTVTVKEPAMPVPAAEAEPSGDSGSLLEAFERLYEACRNGRPSHSGFGFVTSSNVTVQLTNEDLDQAHDAIERAKREGGGA